MKDIISRDYNHISASVKKISRINALDSKLLGICTGTGTPISGNDKLSDIQIDTGCCFLYTEKSLRITKLIFV
jgi:hypothetical protein